VPWQISFSILFWFMVLKVMSLPCTLKVRLMQVLLPQLIMAALSAYYMLKKTDIPLLIKLPFNPEIKRFALMIINLFIRTIALNIALYFGTSFATKYGSVYIAAYTIAINLWFLGAFLIDGYAQCW
jgi:MATE family multidrug resistance protein